MKMVQKYLQCESEADNFLTRFPFFRSRLSPARQFLILFVGFIGSMILPGFASGQEFRATVSGAILDPSGAIVPGASVEVRETHTGTVNKATSDGAGQYVVPFLAPGDYSIKVTKAGFETISRTGITLQAQQHPIINLTLTVGSTNQTVTVEGQAPLLNQENASIGDEISTKAVADLPLNGRTPIMLTMLSEGVVMEEAPEQILPWTANLAFSLGGAPTFTSEELLDGVPNETYLGTLVYSPSQDTAQEVSVRPFDTDASFGHTMGGVINVITKSGTNGLHGTAYEFGQISNLDANTYFNDRTVPVTKITVAHFNQYGLTLGGPVLIPKIYDGKNRLFFFFGWEREEDKTPSVNTYQTVPTDAEKQGDFSALLAGGPTYQLYEPNTGTLVNGTYTRTPVPHNCLTNLSAYCSGVTNAGLTIDPIAAAYLKLYPEPNNTTGVSAITNQDNYVESAPSIDQYSNEFGRLDYNLGARNHVSYDFRHQVLHQVKNNYFGNSTTGNGLLREAYGTTLDDVFTVNSTTILDARLNWTYFNEVHTAPTSQYSPTSLGFPSYLQSASEYVDLPIINFNSSSYQGFGFSGVTLDPTTSYQIFGDVVKLIGSHTLKVGLDGRQYRVRIQSLGNSSGSFTFGNSFVNQGTGASSQPFGGDLAQFEYGLPNSGDYDLQANGTYRSYYVAPFIQDDWRVNSHLTLNLGLRLDIATPYGEKFSRTENGFNPTATNTASAGASAAFAPQSVTKNDTTLNVGNINTLGGLTYPSGNWGAPFQVAPSKGFWSPRIGFSYNPPGASKMVIRGGFGIFVEPLSLVNLTASGVLNTTGQSYQEGFSSSTAFQATSNNYFQSLGTLDNPFPNGFAKASGSSQGSSTFLGSPSSISFFAPIQHDEYSERWTLGVQRSIGPSTLVEVLYIGNHGVHLPVASQNINATQLQYLTTNPFRDQNLATVIGTSVPNPFAGLLPNGNSSFNGATTALSNLLVPYPAYGSTAITEMNETIGQSYFNSGTLHVEQRASQGLTLTANYMFSKLIEMDDRLNDQDIKLERRVSPFDRAQHFTSAVTYDLPFGKGKKFAMGGGRLADELFGGFVVNAIYQFQSGAPIYFQTDIPLQPGMTTANIRSSPRNTSPSGLGNPALINAPAVFVTGSATSCALSASQPCDGTAFLNGQYVNHYRTLPTTISHVRGDGYNNLDASILKNFKFTDKSYLQLRFETFNTLNHPIFGLPNVTSATASNFGYITAVASGSQPRQVQLGGRIVF